jgi:hypothetical protein
MNKFFVDSAVDSAVLTAATGSCYVEVYDKYPNDNTAVLLKAKYISEAGDTLAKLCEILPLKEWAEVLSCKLGQFSSCTQIVAPCDIDNDPETGAREYPDPRTRVGSKLANLHSYIFPNDPHEARRQLVIVRR